MTQNFLNSWVMTIWKTLLLLHHNCMHWWASGSCQECQKLFFFLLLVLVLLTAWLSHPLTENLQSLVAKARRVRGKENPLLRMVENRQAWVHLAFCQNHRPHVLSLVLRCPRSVRLMLVHLVVDHITLFVFVLIRARCVDKWDIVLQNVPTKEKRLPFHLENVRSVPMLWVVQCSIPRAMVEIEHDQNEEDIEYFVAFSIKRQEEVSILDGGATMTVSGFMSVQPVADQYEGTTIETTDVGFTFAGGETEAASTRICIPHADCPQGIWVNVVSNVSTLFLSGLNVLREYGLVIDCHYNRVQSHILKRYFPCAILPTRHLAFEMISSNCEMGQHPVASQPLSTRPWGLHSRAQERGTPSFESSSAAISLLC